MNNHRPILLLILATGILFAFREPGRSLASQHRDAPAAGSVPATAIINKADSGGRPVSLDSAQQCISRFETVMKNHGFTNKAGQKVNIHITRSSLITTGEVFQGKGLLDWLSSTAAEYAAAGKTLMVKVQLGIYDSSYLNTYQSDAALRTRNRDRIAIFMIPYDSAQPVQTGIHAMISPPPPGNGPITGKGYDLGGIQP